MKDLAHWGLQAMQWEARLKGGPAGKGLTPPKKLCAQVPMWKDDGRCTFSLSFWLQWGGHRCLFCKATGGASSRKEYGTVVLRNRALGSVFKDLYIYLFERQSEREVKPFCLINSWKSLKYKEGKRHCNCD